MGASLMAGAHGAKYIERRVLYNRIKPLVTALGGPQAASAFKKHFKPKFLRRSLFKGMLGGAVAGAIPGAALASFL